jgi:molybdenum cofactor cytidylyltransferase
MVSGIILTGGLSTRMEANKLLLPYEGCTVIERVVEKVCAAGLGEVIVVTGHQSDKVKKVLQKYPVKFVHNPNYSLGMTTSIQEGVKEATGDGYMICLGDMVQITSKEYGWLKIRFERVVQVDKASIVLPLFNHAKGNPVLFSSLYKNKILQHTNMNGCCNILEENKNSIKYIEMPSNHVLKDINSFNDYYQLVN